MRTAGLVLAAGAGTRYGQPKAPVMVEGERLVDRAVRVLHEGGCDPVLVVLGAWVGRVEGADIVLNSAWPEGMGSSLRSGLQSLDEHDADIDAVLVTLVDLPGLTGEAVRRLAECDSDLAVATYDGAWGHPVRFARSLWPEVREVAVGDEGARRMLRDRDDVTTVEVGDVAQPGDLDAPGD